MSYLENKRLLFLDDELNLLNSLRRGIERQGYEVVITTDPSEAIELVQKEQFAVVLSDYRMPNMVGTEFLSYVKEMSPESVRILLTGYADMDAAIHAVNKAGVYKYLTKPWEEDSIKSVLKDAFNQYNFKEENRLKQNEVKDKLDKLHNSTFQLEEIIRQKNESVTDLTKKMEESFFSKIKLLLAMTQMGSPQIAEHCRRTSILAANLAKEMGWSGRDLLELQIAGYLHDIAESQIGKSSDHSKKSHEISLLIPNLGKAYEYIKQHHELLDGSGYPNKLKGDQILLGARILAVVDFYDEHLHLHSKDEGATPSKVLLKLKEQSANKYDMQVVAHFYNYLKNSGQINDEYYEKNVSIITVIPGMILAKDLYTKSGKLILAKDNMITEEYLAKMLKKHSEDPLVEDIYVYKNLVA